MLGGARRTEAALGRLWGHLAMQTTAKGQAAISPQSGGCDCSHGIRLPSADTIATATVSTGAALPGPAETPATRLTTARIVSKRERANQINIRPQDGTKPQNWEEAPAPDPAIHLYMWCTLDWAQVQASAVTGTNRGNTPANGVGGREAPSLYSGAAQPPHGCKGVGDEANVDRQALRKV